METVQTKKIISLVPSITEIVYYLHLEEHLIGVTENCNYPNDTANKCKIGTFGRPDLAKILSINPDIVLADKAVHKKIIEELKDNNINVISFTNRTLEEVFNSMNEISKACGRENCSQPLIESLRKRVQKLKQDHNNQRPRVFRLMNTAPFITPGIGSFQYDALKLAGAQLMDFQSDDSYIKVTMEQIKEFDPEVILFCGVEKGQAFKPRCKGCNVDNPICQRTIDDILYKEWEEITAVKAGKVYPIACDTLCRPGPRLIDGMEKLCNHYLRYKYY